MELSEGLYTGNLPEDIVRIIFETLVEDDNCRPTYASVSKQLQSWIEPIVYRDVIVDIPGKFHRTVTDPLSTKASAFFGLCVKSLVLQSHISTQDILDILNKCHSIRSLVLWRGDDFDPAEVEDLHALLSSSLLSPAMLSITGAVFKPDEFKFTHPIFTGVTHLEIPVEVKDPWKWEPLRDLERLTHLGVDLYFNVEDNHPDPAETATRILSFCPTSLRVFVVCPLPNDWETDDAAVHKGLAQQIEAFSQGDIDPRVVVTTYGSPFPPEQCNFEVDIQFLLHAWGNSSKGNAFWTRAENIVEERRRVKTLEGWHGLTQILAPLQTPSERALGVYCRSLRPIDIPQ